jgi:DMSO/TMAO reductase YedYZ heme-binding membrane subunit
VIALIVVIASSGLGFILFGFVDWLVLVLLLVCSASLVGQFLQLQRWWRRSVEDIS